MEQMRSKSKRKIGLGFTMEEISTGPFVISFVSAREFDVINGDIYPNISRSSSILL